MSKSFQFSGRMDWGLLDRNEWMEARWAGAVFITRTGPDECPQIVLSFEDHQHGMRAFEGLLAKVGRGDEADRVRISVIDYGPAGCMMTLGPEVNYTFRAEGPPGETPLQFHMQYFRAVARLPGFHVAPEFRQACARHGRVHLFPAAVGDVLERLPDTWIWTRAPVFRHVTDIKRGQSDPDECLLPTAAKGPDPS